MTSTWPVVSVTKFHTWESDWSISSSASIMRHEEQYCLSCLAKVTDAVYHVLICACVCICVYGFIFLPRSGELRPQKLKSHLLRAQKLKVLPLKPRVGQYIAIHATLTARDSTLLVSTLPVCSPAFYPNFSRAFPVLCVANTGSCVGPLNKIGHPAHCYSQLMQVPLLSNWFGI